MDIADTLRQKNLNPVAVRPDHFHLGSVEKLGKGGIVQPRAGADIQPPAVGGDDAGLVGFGFLRAANGSYELMGGNLKAVFTDGSCNVVGKSDK